MQGMSISGATFALKQAMELPSLLISLVQKSSGLIAPDRTIQTSPSTGQASTPVGKGQIINLIV